MILSDNVFGDLRSLAGTIATADAPAIVELELLASLATEAASCLRRAAAENRETLRRRIETALAAFPEIAARDYARGEDAGEEAVAGLERAAATALRERANLEAAMNAGKAAFAAQEIAAAMTSLERARDAQTAIRDAEEAVRRWLAETCLVLPPATTPSVSDAPPGPAALPEAPGAELRDTVVAIPEAPTGTPVPDEPLSASTALNEPPAVEPAAVPETTVAEAVWSAFRSGRLGLAEALLEVATPDPGTVVLSAAVALAAMALVAQGDGELDDLAREATVRALDAWQSGGAESTVSKAAFALLVSASATLALLAPGSDQRTLLAVLSDAEPRPGLQLARTVAAVPVLASAREVMAALVSEEEWEAEVERVTAGLRAWHEAQLSRQIRYAAATDVWQRLLRPEDAFGAVLRTVKDGGASRVGEVQRFLDRVDPEVLIRDTEAVVRGRHAVRRNPIEGPAYRALQEACEECIGQLRRWLEVAGRAPAGGGSDGARVISEQRNRLRAQVMQADNEFGAMSGDDAAVAATAQRMLRRLSDVLEGRSPARNASRPGALLGQDLLPIPAIRFDAAWQRERLSPALRDDLENCEALPLHVCAQRRMDAGDVLGAELAIAAMPDMDEKPPLQRELRNTLEKLKADRSTLVEQARVEVEEAERAGRLDTGQAQELVERLERLRAEVERCSALDAPTLFSALAQEVKEARGLLDAGRDAVRERIRLRLDALGRAAGEGETAAIERLLDIGQFALAEDLVERLEDGEPFETGRVMPGEAAFDAFFPERAQHLASWLRRTPTAMARLGVGALALPPDLAASSGAKGVELSAVAQPWADCVRNRGNHLRDNLVRLLTELGFTDPELPYFAAPPRNATEAGFQLRVRPLRDRETAVLPQFGSEANGAYRLLCLWGKRDADDVAQALAAATGAAGPTLVLFFAPLDAEQRRRLAALARADRLLSAIVVDEALALHLASLDTARLATLFACTIPFTDARPWAETGTPPPEMFFGRSREVRAVTSMSGEFTHLLYGGRQLGKTAVLRQVEREAADAPDVVVRYISIADIGRTHTPEELWPRLADELAGAGVPIDRQRAGDRGRNFRSAVIAWLDEKPARRILLLLDEADEFFVKDRQNGFPVTELLRTLAVDRDRRFKPVFAGLKNVQKLVRDPNSPLAHLGTPRVVGPLIRGQERNEAAALVTWPFAALGYRMDSAVITRILAFANYYPSLIQVVCQRLLRVLRQQQGGGGPPWTVRMEDVERVLEMPEVRSALFERFRITLELDQRYNLLTLIAADFSLDDPELLARGIDAGTLRSFAADAWPNGFPPEFGGDAFDALLDEMVGLGLFRLVGTGHYALRSGNLAHLIGNRAEIRRQTGEFAARPAPPESDPLESRRTVGERPSLLTARQEHALLGPGGGAVILAGLRLARIDRWRDSIDAACRAAKPKLDVEVRYLTSPYAEAQYERTLATLAGRGGKACLALYVVPPEAPWNAAWVEQAQAQVAAKSLPLRVIFVADAARTWHWLGDPGRPNALCAGGPDRLVAELTAGPWSRTDVDLWIANDRLRGMPPTLRSRRPADGACWSRSSHRRANAIARRLTSRLVWKMR